MSTIRNGTLAAPVMVVPKVLSRPRETCPNCNSEGFMRIAETIFPFTLSCTSPTNGGPSFTVTVACLEPLKGLLLKRQTISDSSQVLILFLVIEACVQPQLENTWIMLMSSL